MKSSLIMLLLFMVSMTPWKVYGGASENGNQADKLTCYCQPGDTSCWPSIDDWNKLRKALNGNLEDSDYPISVCDNVDDDSAQPLKYACSEQLKTFKTDPFWVRKYSGLTQSAGMYK